MTPVAVPTTAMKMSVETSGIRKPSECVVKV
jgi:hypothetical protein